MAPLMTIKDLAARLNVPESWVRDKVTAEQIPFTRIGRHVRFTEQHLAEIVAEGERRPTPPRRLAAVPTFKAPGPSQPPSTPPPPPRPTSPPRSERKESAA